MPERMLGKKAPRIDTRTLKLAKYTASLPDPPTDCYFTSKVKNWQGALLNNTLGDCVPAASGHMIMQWTAYASTEATVTNTEILAAYEAIGGYVPGDPSTDNGCDMLTALNYWRKSGIAGHKIAAFASLDYDNTKAVKQTVELFANVYLGLALPLTAQDQVNAGEDWTVDDSNPFNAEPGSWGGHCVPIVGYNASTLVCLTWGALQTMTWDWMLRYADEAYAVLSTDWLNGENVSASGFDLATLQEDLNAL